MQIDSTMDLFSSLSLPPPRDPPAISAAHILDVLQDYLQRALSQGIIQLVASGKGQARNDSTANEREIGRSLSGFALGHPLFTESGLVFEAATNGRWYDFLVRSHDESVWLPINLKVSSLSGNDNLSSKEGLFYALTGIRPGGGVIRNWDLFCRNMAAHVKREHCDADYYYLVVEKAAPGAPVGRVFWTSLLQLRRVTPNGSNPPFQCKWKENTERTDCSRRQAVDNLLDVIGQTFVLRAKALDAFKAHIVPGFEGELRSKWSGATPLVEGEAG